MSGRYQAPDLRQPGEDFPYRGRHVTFIRIDATGQISQAQLIEEKRTMLAELGPKDALLAAWTGNWKTDVFWLDPEKAKSALI